VVPSFALDVTVALTNLVPTTPVRRRRPQAVFAMERLMDKAARALALDPAALRARNLIRRSRCRIRSGSCFVTASR
jgi:carbon-monoxide dehydrogenase large subunit